LEKVVRLRGKGREKETRSVSSKEIEKTFYLSTTGFPKGRRAPGPLMNVLMVSAGTRFRQANLAAPGSWSQPTAVATWLKVSKEGVGMTSGIAPEKSIPALKGALFVGCRASAVETDKPPAD
jgi:hypothetical protein